METAQVADVRTRIIGQLSRGYRSRVGLAEALVADPPILILDEPTAGLDPNQIRQVRNLIRDLAGKVTVILSTHILPEVEYTCGRVLIIHEGRLVGEGVPGDLRARGQKGGQVILEGRGNRERVAPALEKISGVKRIVDVTQLQPDPSMPLLRIRLETESQAEVLENIFAVVVETGFVLREMRREGASLEDVFASLTTEDASDVAHDAGSGPAPEKKGGRA